MGMTPLEKAKKLLSARRFPAVVELLEPLIMDYSDSFQFYYMLGTACLYLGDIGGAELYYRTARKISISDVQLITAQAVLFLRRGEISRAVEYYLQALEYDPENELSKKALEFIKHNSASDIFVHLVQTGNIKRFYPRLGLHSKLIKVGVFAAILLIAALGIFTYYKPPIAIEGNRADLSEFVLSVDERRDSLIQDTASSVFRYILTQSDLEKSYASAQEYFQSYRDNSSQVEINRILNSNASTEIRQKARLLAEYLEEPTFDSNIESFTYEQIREDVWLYLDTWVIWSGRVTNVEETQTEYRCDFLIGYDTLQKVEGFVPLVMQQPVNIDTALPIQVLAQVGLEDGRLLLRGKSIYQPLVGNN